MEALPNNSTAPALKIEEGTASAKLVNFDTVIQGLQEPGDPILFKIRGNPPHPLFKPYLLLQNNNGDLQMTGGVEIHARRNQATGDDPEAVSFLKKAGEKKQSLENAHPGLDLRFIGVSYSANGSGLVQYAGKDTDPFYVKYELTDTEIALTVFNDDPSHPHLGLKKYSVDTPQRDIRADSWDNSSEAKIKMFTQRWLAVCEMLSRDGRYDYPARKQLEFELRPYYNGERYLGSLAMGASQRPEKVKSKVLFERLEFEGITDRTKLTFDRLAGLHEPKRQLDRVIKVRKYPEVFTKWGLEPTNGIYLYGPPGTGKTSLVVALANEIGAELMDIKITDILNMYFGESERKLMEIFKKAKSAKKPTILFFDEFDTLIADANFITAGGNRGRLALSGLFKKEMNGIGQANPSLIVIAATNNPERVDPSLIRSGRLDLKIYVPLPNEAERAEIWGVKVTDMYRTPDSENHDFVLFSDDIDFVALSRITDGMSGADVETILKIVCEEKAFEEINRGCVVPISQQDLLTQIRDFRQA